MKLIPWLAMLVAILLFHCGKTKHTQDAIVTADYKAVQQAAERFSPAIGVYGGEIVVPMLFEPATLNPITATDALTGEFTRYLFEGLIRIDGVTLKPMPGLAQSWDSARGGMEWTFHLRPNLQWSDGRQFSAFDVDFTFNDLIFNDSLRPNPAHDLFLIKGKKPSVKVVDSQTVRFSLPAPYAPFLRMMSQEILPKHKYDHYVRRGLFTRVLSLQTPPESIAVSGPFTVELIVPTQKIVLKKNPLYWQKDSAGNRLPYLDKLVYVTAQNHAEEVARFKRGELDYLTAVGEDFSGLQKDTGKTKYRLYRVGPATGSTFLMFNQNAGSDERTGKPYLDSVKASWFRNESFRKAVALALNRDAMIEGVLCGLGFCQGSALSPAEGAFYDSNVVHYPFDTAKAAQLLRSAGFSYRISDSVWADSSGHPVDFYLAVSGGNGVREKIADIVLKNLEQFGFRVHFQVCDFAELNKKIDNPPFAWDAVLISLSGSTEPLEAAQVWRSSGPLHMWHPRQKHPATAWEASIDSIFDAAEIQYDESSRKHLFDQWQMIVSEHVPVIFTVLPERVVGVAAKFKNINPSINGGILHNLERVYIDSVHSFKDIPKTF